MNATNLEERRCRCNVLIIRDARSLKEHRGSCGTISQRDTQGQHKVAVKNNTCSAGETDRVCVCVCVCVFFPFSLDIKFVGHTSRGHTGGRSHGISHPPSFCSACLNFSREKDSAIPFLKKNQNAPRPSEHPPVRGGKCQNV